MSELTRSVAPAGGERHTEKTGGWGAAPPAVGGCLAVGGCWAVGLLAGAVVVSPPDESLITEPFPLINLLTTSVAS